MILETEVETESGAAVVIDFMSRRPGAADLFRIVRGVKGRTAFRTELAVRFDYGETVPWVTRERDGRLQFVAGPNRLSLATSVRLRGQDMRTSGVFEVGEGEEASFAMTYSRSYREVPAALAPADALAADEAQWAAWSQGFRHEGPYKEAVLRSAVTLKGLAHWETGGIVAAATTSVPERLGGPRNWDYRYCWLRDAAFTLTALMATGFLGEAEAWRNWLLRAVAGRPADLQIMYGLAGERRLDERELPHLKGFAGAQPVRIGNAAAGQRQLDVYGELIGAFYAGRQAGLGRDKASWGLELALLDHLETVWSLPDEGIWEVRGGARHFTHSKVMAWTAFDRGIRTVEAFGVKGPVERWRTVREEIKTAVLEQGWNARKGAFVQSFGSEAIDASLLLISRTGFLPPDDPRIGGTVLAVERELLVDGLVKRYSADAAPDGLPPGEGAFLACTFWLADAYIDQGRIADGRALFERLLQLRNDVGLLAEEYDPLAGRQLGNFPQAFSHLALMATAGRLSEVEESPPDPASADRAVRAPPPKTAAESA
jgi:GH15 family glucan-1,4-alpha-glucosidase